jgi:asparagine synthase (glutamine-hydrolysing)
MCGIAGIYTQNPEWLDSDVLEKMRSSILHRGPDDSGLDVRADKGVALINTRLSIIDLGAGGHQPMWTADKQIGIAYNGEIYNFKTIRTELEQDGYKFRSNSDTEVILRGYQEWGIEVVHRLNGMFAIAIWDGRAEHLWLVRDRLGKKPLYYWHHRESNTLVFASEIKALLQYRQIERRVDPDSLHCYLTLGYVPAPHTMFAGIRKLAAAHRLLFQRDGDPVVERYWEMRNLGASQSSRAEHREKIRALVEDAVEARLISDVPLGAFLSGGVDSSIVVGVMSQKLREPVRTFSAAFQVGPRSFKYNVDAEMAELVSRHFRTQHTRLTITPESNLMGHLWRAVYHADEPHANPTLVTTYLLAQSVRQHGVTVMLSGDGSDEIFGGYQSYRRDRQLDWLGHIPHPARASLAAIAEATPHGKLLAKGLRKADAAPLSVNRYLSWWTVFDLEARRGLLNRDWWKGADAPAEAVQKTLARAETRNNQIALAFADLNLWIPEESNMRVDKMAMAHSLEPRAPFLDYRLVEYAMRIPFEQKVGCGSLKQLLKQTFADLLPPEVARRSKWGWFSPVHYWIKDLIWGDAQELIRYLPQTGIFNSSVCDLLNEYPSPNPRRIWQLMVFALWHQMYIAHAPNLSV